jgi:hypothetical protein
MSEPLPPAFVKSYTELAERLQLPEKSIHRILVKYGRSTPRISPEGLDVSAWKRFIEENSLQPPSETNPE